MEKYLPSVRGKDVVLDQGKHKGLGNVMYLEMGKEGSLRCWKLEIVNRKLIN